MRHHDLSVIHKKPKKMLIYACVYFLIAAVTCEPSAEVQNQLPRLLVTPNQLASGALLRLQQNSYLQSRAVLYNPKQPGTIGVRQDIQYFPSSVGLNPGDLNVRTFDENLLLTNSRIQQTQSSQPGVLLQDSAQTGHLDGRGRAPVGFPTKPRGVGQESDRKDSTDRSNDNTNKQITERQSGMASIALNPRTFLKLQQTPSARPGVLISYPSQIETREDGDRTNNGAETSKRDNEGSDINKNKLQPVVTKSNGVLLTPSQVPFGSLIRFQENLSQQPGVFLYNPTQQATPTKKDVDEDGDEEEGEIETTTGRGLNPKTAAKEVTEKNLTNQKLTSPNGENGKYYVYHPTGLLQKVTYSTTDDKAKMSFVASLRYQNVEPIREPIYTYDPKTFVFRRV